MAKKIIFTLDEIRIMAEQYGSGMSFRDIAIIHVCCKNTIRTMLLSHGVTANVGRSISVKMNGKPSARKGIKCSKETCDKIAASRIGKEPWNKGIPHSTETKLKMKSRKKFRRELGLKNVVINRKKTISDLEKKKKESIRQASKRFVKRVLNYNGKRKNIPSSQYLGYSTKELVLHLGAKKEGDHIDHIVPIVEFIRRGITKISVINAFPNLRFLPAKENQKKSATIPVNSEKIIEECFRFVESRRQDLTIYRQGEYQSGIKRGFV